MIVPAGVKALETGLPLKVLEVSVLVLIHNELCFFSTCAANYLKEIFDCEINK